MRDAVAPLHGDPIGELRRMIAGTATTVVLSNHYLRYAVLPWSDALGSNSEWTAYARHAFTSTYGAVSSAWEVRICSTGARSERVACAMDRALLEELKNMPGVVSIEPYLMSAFNGRRKAFGATATWFILQEPGRVASCLIEDGGWKRIRTRRVDADWRQALPDLLDREAALEDSLCERAVVCAEEDIPTRAGRYALFDASLPNGADPASRPRIMALQ